MHWCCIDCQGRAGFPFVVGLKRKLQCWTSNTFLPTLPALVIALLTEPVLVLDTGRAQVADVFLLLMSCKPNHACWDSELGLLLSPKGIEPHTGITIVSAMAYAR